MRNIVTNIELFKSVRSVIVKDQKEIWIKKIPLSWKMAQWVTVHYASLRT